MKFFHFNANALSTLFKATSFTLCYCELTVKQANINHRKKCHNKSENCSKTHGNEVTSLANVHRD